MPQEEGRIRFKPTAGTIAASFQYDYMLKDHLGNVRMVLTEEQQQDKYPIASLEDTKLSTEQGYYDINPNYIRKTAVNPLPGLPTYTNNYNGIGNNPTDAAFEQANSKNLYRINGNENKTGLGITLKVMAGDKVNIFGNSYYSSAVVNNAPCPGCALSALNLITNFLNAPNAAATSAAHGAVTPSTVEAQSGANITGILQNAQNNQATTYNNRPRAFINYILFDEQFKYAGGGTSIVGAAGAFTKHQNDPQLQDIAIPKNGYIYVYCSNESNTDVFFDNLQVVHNRGAILEETHYYPFGLTMAGISSKAAGSLLNKHKYNGKELQSQEFSDGSGLELYDYGARQQDPQIGRFNIADPLSSVQPDKSPYNYVGNNPLNRIDPDGRWDIEVHAYNNRAQSGYAVMIVKNNDGAEVYRTVVKTVGTGGRVRNAKNADTPQGEYKILGWRKTGDGTGYNRVSFGPNNILALDYQGDEGGGRNGMHVHGGRQEGKYVGRKNLASTHGCMRINDDDIKTMKSITTQLEKDDPTEKKGKLTLTDDLKTPVQYNDDRNTAGADQFPKTTGAAVDNTTQNVIPTPVVSIPVDNTYVKPPVTPIVQKRN